jgi:5-methylcytosine-specific restriction endonuclease McrA
MASSDKWQRSWHKVGGKWELELSLNPAYKKKSSPTSKSTSKRESSTTPKTRTSSSSGSSSYRTSNTSVNRTREHLQESSVYEVAQKNYKKAINSREWQEMREAVLRKDGYECKKCGDSSNLHVHHKFYVLGHAIWDYPSHALETLCEDCHFEYHENHSIPVYERMPRPGERLTSIKMTKCPRCEGRGIMCEYLHVEDGICFLCYGSGYKNLYTGPTIVGSIRKK